MQKLYVVAALIFFPIGFIMYILKPSILIDLTNLASQAGAILQGVLIQVTVWWNGLPELAKTLIAGGIPTAFMLFFAWTKSRALTKLQQTERLAQQRIGGLQEQLSGLTDVSGENERLRRQVKSLENSDVLGAANKLATDRLAEVERLKGELSRIQMEHSGEVRAYSSLVNMDERQMIARLKQLGYDVRIPVE